MRRLLASGGMAEIFLGAKTGPGGFEKRVVVKRINKALLNDREVQGMFLDEARIQALLDHPNIVQIHDFGEEEGTYYLVMEHVDGPNVRWLIDNARSQGQMIPVEHVLRIYADVLSGLHYAHTLRTDDGSALRVVHRDISPVNVLVTKTGHAKLCDFGVAKSKLQHTLTQVGLIKGKFRYMAPEQLNAKSLDARTDVFAAGVSLWETLANRRIFNHEKNDDAIRAIRRGEYPAISDVREVPKAVDRLLNRALQLDPEDRYESALAFQKRCEEILRLLPKTSNSATLAKYVQKQLGEEREPTMMSPIANGLSIANDQTQVEQQTVASVASLETQEVASSAGKIASAVLLAPASAFGGVARAVEALSGYVRTDDHSSINVRLHNSSSEDTPTDPEN